MRSTVTCRLRRRPCSARSCGMCSTCRWNSVRRTQMFGHQRHSLMCCPGPILPPSRDWTWLAPNPLALEWTYVMFDWDNYFDSYMAGLDPLMKDIAYSNLIQITKVTPRIVPFCRRCC
jgi:hypothetical protein